MPANFVLIIVWVILVFVKFYNLGCLLVLAICTRRDVRAAHALEVRLVLSTCEMEI